MRPVLRRYLGGAVAALALVASIAVAAPSAQADTVSFEKVSYSPVIYRVTLQANGRYASRRPIDRAAWQAYG